LQQRLAFAGEHPLRFEQCVALGDQGIARCDEATERRKPLQRALEGFDHGRGERIRTSGLYVPNVALYQAKLHPVSDTFFA
jgi:hypothetical protein